MHGDQWVNFTLMYTKKIAKKCFDMCIGHVGMHTGNLFQQECKLMNLPYVMQILSPSTQQVPSRKANDLVVLSYLTPLSNSIILLMQHWIYYGSSLIKEQFGIYILFKLFCKNESVATICFPCKPFAIHEIVLVLLLLLLVVPQFSNMILLTTCPWETYCCNLEL